MSSSLMGRKSRDSECSPTQLAILVTIIACLVTVISFALAIAGLSIALQARNEALSAKTVALAIPPPNTPPVAPLPTGLTNLVSTIEISNVPPNSSLGNDYSWYLDNVTGIVYIRLPISVANAGALGGMLSEQKIADPVPRLTWPLTPGQYPSDWYDPDYEVPDINVSAPSVRKRDTGPKEEAAQSLTTRAVTETINAQSASTSTRVPINKRRTPVVVEAVQSLTARAVTETINAQSASTSTWVPINKRRTPVVVLAPYRGLAPYLNSTVWYYTNQGQSNPAFGGAPQLLYGSPSDMGLASLNDLLQLVNGSTSSSDGYLTTRPVTSVRFYTNNQYSTQPGARPVQAFLVLNSTTVNFGWTSVSSGTSNLRTQIAVEWGGVPANTIVRGQVTGSFSGTPTNANAYFIFVY